MTGEPTEHDWINQIGDCMVVEIRGRDDRMKIVIWVLIPVLLLVGTVQMVGGTLRRHDFESRLHDIATQVEERNHDDIKRQVVAEGSKMHFQVASSGVNVQYAATSDLGYAQRMVSGIGTFENHRATIIVDYTQSILFVPIKRHAEGTALIESAARPKRAQKMPE